MQVLCECLIGHTEKCNKLPWRKVMALHQLVTTQVEKNKGRMTANSVLCLCKGFLLTCPVSQPKHRLSLKFYVNHGCLTCTSLTFDSMYVLTTSTYCPDSLSRKEFLDLHENFKILSTGVTNSSVYCGNQPLAFPTAVQTKLWVVELCKSWLKVLSKEWVALQLWVGRIGEKRRWKTVAGSWMAQKR